MPLLAWALIATALAAERYGFWIAVPAALALEIVGGWAVTWYENWEARRQEKKVKS